MTLKSGLNAERLPMPSLKHHVQALWLFFDVSSLSIRRAN